MLCEDPSLRAVLCMLLLAFGLATLAAASEPPPAVSASPPKEAVPAPPVTQALQAHIRSCNAAAEARQLYGTQRRAFLHSCLAAHHAATHSAAASAAHPGTVASRAAVGSRSASSSAP